MTRVEVECYRQKEKRSSVLMDSRTIKPRDIGKIGFLAPRTRILVFGDRESNRSGKVIIAGEDKGIKVFKYEDPDDEYGEQVDTKHPIEVSGSQELSVVSKSGKITREVVVFVGASWDDEDYESVPDDPDLRERLFIMHKRSGLVLSDFQ